MAQGLEKLKNKPDSLHDSEMDKATVGKPPSYAHAQKMNDVVRKNAELQSEWAGSLPYTQSSKYPLSAGEEFMMEKFKPTSKNSTVDWQQISKNFRIAAQQPSNIPSLQENKSGFEKLKKRK
jgi:hypothetical protein